MTSYNTIERQMVLKASREKVWNAITQADLITQWFGTDTKIPKLEVGQEIVFEWMTDEYDNISRGVIETVEPMTCFAYKWENEKSDLSKPLNESILTLVTFTLSDVAGGTQLTLTETGFASLPDGEKCFKQNSGGWTAELAELKEYVEKEVA